MFFEKTPAFAKWYTDASAGSLCVLVPNGTQWAWRMGTSCWYKIDSDWPGLSP